MNDTLMDQCRREAPYKAKPHPDAHRFKDFRTVVGPTVSGHVLYCEQDEAQNHADELNEAYAAALYAERSKRPPMITVEEAIEVMRGHLFRDQHPAESADTYLDEMYADLHRCLTAAATNNTNDNG